MLQSLRLGFVPLAIVAMCSGCSGPDRAPTLALRPIERLDTSEPKPSATPVVAETPLPEDLAKLVSDADAADTGFTRDLGGARSTIEGARAAAAGSEAWVAAQQALSRLEEARGPVTTALAALDRARIAGGGPAVDTAYARIDVADQREREALAPLTAMLQPE